jgi:hypothetical protein
VGAVLAWAYQSGSVRLGVVDLFACEISTLCRVATVVDTARRYAGKFDQPPTAPADTAGPRPPPYHFASQENYFPVFESNTRDLQTLEARVVINITEFYTSPPFPVGTQLDQRSLGGRSPSQGTA